MQAFLVQDLFLDIVVSLSGQYNGKFRVRVCKEDGGAGPDYEAWDGSDTTIGNFRLGSIKSIRSAAFKAEVAYGGDVSRVLDMVRETIFFDTVGAPTTCMSPHFPPTHA